jgi:hypothetical protein
VKGSVLTLVSGTVAPAAAAVMTSADAAASAPVGTIHVRRNLVRVTSWERM